MWRPSGFDDQIPTGGLISAERRQFRSGGSRCFDKWGFWKKPESFCLLLFIRKSATVWRLHTHHSPFNGFTSFYTIISFSNFQSLFPAAFKQQTPRETWQEKCLCFIYLFFFIRSTVCHFLMFTRLAGWRFLQEAERCLYANGPERCSVALANSRRHLRKSHSLCSSEVRKEKQCCQSDSVGMMDRCLLLLSDTNTRDEMEINQSLQLDKTVRPAWVVKDVVVESAHVCCLRLPISCGGGGRKAGILYLTTPL